MTKKLILALFLTAVLACAQSPVALGSHDAVAVQTGTPDAPLPLHARAMPAPEGIGGTPVHPVRYEVRCGAVSWSKGLCAHIGDVMAEGWTHNLRTSAGTTWQYNQMAGTTAAVGTYIGLTNTAITPAEADTTLSGEIATNGLARANATPTNASTTLSVPGAPTPTVVGTTGATTYYYWVAACNQGICTTPSATSGSVTTANATLSSTNYVSVAFTGQLGAATYQVYRTTSNSAPASGAQTVLINGTPACSTAGTVVSCTVIDSSNTLTLVTIPASNLTNFGKYTLVYTWTASATQSAQAFAVFNASSSGTMVFEGTFTQVTLNNGDTLQLTESVYF